MKLYKRFAAALLAGIMALAMLTACSDSSDSGNPEFDAKVESACLAIGFELTNTAAQ